MVKSKTIPTRPGTSIELIEPIELTLPGQDCGSRNPKEMATALIGDAANILRAERIKGPMELFERIHPNGFDSKIGGVQKWHDLCFSFRDLIVRFYENSPKLR